METTAKKTFNFTNTARINNPQQIHKKRNPKSYLDRSLKKISEADTAVEEVSEAESGGVGDEVAGCGTPCVGKLWIIGW